MSFCKLQEGKRTNEALLDAQDKINSLMEQLNSRSDAESRELQKAIADRDNALNVSFASTYKYCLMR